MMGATHIETKIVVFAGVKMFVDGKVAEEGDS